MSLRKLNPANCIVLRFNSPFVFSIARSSEFVNTKSEYFHHHCETMFSKINRGEVMIKDLAQKLQMLRIKHRYTQNQVAMKIGVSPSSISSYESGERTPSVDNLLALSHVYGCSTDFLLGKPNTEQGLFLNTKGYRTSRLKRSRLS